MDNVWECEHCNESQTGEPAGTETFPGHEGTVSLWFCSGCYDG